MVSEALQTQNTRAKKLNLGVEVVKAPPQDVALAVEGMNIETVLDFEDLPFKADGDMEVYEVEESDFTGAAKVVEALDIPGIERKGLFIWNAFRTKQLTGLVEEPKVVSLPRELKEYMFRLIEEDCWVGEHTIVFRASEMASEEKLLPDSVKQLPSKAALEVYSGQEVPASPIDSVRFRAIVKKGHFNLETPKLDKAA